MKRYFLATAALLSLSAGGALAAGPDATTTPATPPVAAASPYYGYYNSGYVFPNDGSPSGTQSMARYVPQPRHGIFSEVYLYPPSEGDNGGAS